MGKNDVSRQFFLFGKMPMLCLFLFAAGFAESHAQSGQTVSPFIGDSVRVHSWKVVRKNPQHSFSKTVPPGNYSGITHLYDDVYAVVSDKSDSALYFNFRIQVDPITGDLEHVENLGYTMRVDGSVNDGKPWLAKETGFDLEAIAKVSNSTLVIASEGKCMLKEYPGTWEDKWDAKEFYPNYNFESLTYDSIHHFLWTIPESVLRKDGTPASPENPVANKLRLMQYQWQNFESSANGTKHDSRKVDAEYAYLMDPPSVSRKAETYVMGVSELCALPDGQLLVLEREAFIPKIKLGAFCKCKLYLINPMQEKSMGETLGEDTPFVGKRLLTEWRTNLSLFDFSFANYEGMCLGPKLSDGSQVIILLSDSQNQYAGILKDCFKTIVIK